ncbi:hypothetical protein MA16_Dca016551 [Dendrobium catenatum]|uniref:Uncharacterized protein n=1 Tax=Dendrobium catenatum TaxID=906689 RepID=A0A2I0WNN1_9ASPA|nr:hypothetical protein MA16_Dca016551 [Dendrobium catenatum]
MKGASAERGPDLGGVLNCSVLARMGGKRRNWGTRPWASTCSVDYVIKEESEREEGEYGFSGAE